MLYWMQLELRTFCTAIFNLCVLSISGKKPISSQGLTSVVVPKLISLKCLSCKSGIMEILSRIIGCNITPLIYIILENTINDFENHYDSREVRLVSCITYLGMLFVQTIVTCTRC